MGMLETNEKIKSLSKKKVCKIIEDIKKNPVGIFELKNLIMRIKTIKLKSRKELIEERISKLNNR